MNAEAVTDMVTRIWREVLSIDGSDMEDDFFEMGGSSLLAMILIARLQETFSIALRLEPIFEDPRLAAVLRRTTDALQGEASGRS